MQTVSLIYVIMWAACALGQRQADRTRPPSPCDINNGQCSDNCVPSPGYTIPNLQLPSGYYCTCHHGKRIFNATTCLLAQHPCLSRSPYCGRNQRCIPTNTDDFQYICACLEGYVKNAQGRCVNVPEDSQRTFSDTVLNGDNNGHTSQHTLAPNQTSPPSTSPPHPCDVNNGDCEHTCSRTGVTSRVCVCDIGYRLDIDGTSCIEIDPCENNGGCSHVCEANWPNRTCSCPAGYKLGFDFKSCEDVDECAENLANCEQQCENVPGSYRCPCKTGYKMVGRHSCEDIDECQVHNGGCSDSCHNTPGSYRCSCPRGFFLSDGKNCEQRWKCSQFGCAHSCHHPVVYFEPYCTCNQGYQLNADKKTCRDLDECGYGYHRCSHTCVNAVGSYTCSCPTGMKLSSDQRTCKSEVTCATLRCTYRCVQNDPALPAKCTCQRGYSLDTDGRTCKDIDECQASSHGCSETCVNTLGDYYCDCGPGRRLSNDLRTCVEETTGITCPRPRLSRGSFSGCASRIRALPGTTCKRQCNPGYVLRGKPETVCRDDGSWSNNNGRCEDIDECKDNKAGCEQDCYNFRGGYTCGCGSGFKLRSDRKSCRDATPPTFASCPQNMDATTDPGRPNATVTWALPQYSDNVPIGVALRGPSSTQDLPIGFNSIVYNATDAEGNQATCFFVVHVKDEEAPVFDACPSPISINVKEGVLEKHITWDVPMATDNSGDVTVTDNAPYNNVFPFGQTTVRYVAKDAAGNIATCEFLVNLTRTECKALRKPKNGTHDCDTWRLGKFCHVNCDPGFGFVDPPPERYVCGPLGTWVPDNLVPDCHPVAAPLATDLSFTATYKVPCPVDKDPVINMFMNTHMDTLRSLCWHNDSETCVFTSPTITCGDNQFEITLRSREDLSAHPNLPSFMHDLTTDLQKKSRIQFFLAVYGQFGATTSIVGPKINVQNLALVPELKLTCADGQVSRNHNCVICGDQPCENFLPTVPAQ